MSADSSRWRMIRVPAELADKLTDLARDMERCHAEGRASLPSEFVERCPLHHVIQKAVDDLEAHKLRSKAPRRKKVGS